MASVNFRLLTQRRFLPLFIVQFFGAFNDNVVRFAMLIMASYTLYKGHSAQAAQMSLYAGALFMLPYVLLSGLAGQMADRLDMSRMIRWIKLAELGIMGIAMLGFWRESTPLLFTALFLMGVHSTFFGPVKYAILPKHLSTPEIMGGTGLIEAGTFLAILLGQLLGSLAPPHLAGWAATGFALCGIIASRLVPPAPPVAGGGRIDFNIGRGILMVCKPLLARRDLFLAVCGISWFFAIGLVVQTQFAPLVSGVFHADKNVTTILLLVYTLSVALGSVVIGALLKGVISSRYVPMIAYLMAFGCLDLGYAAAHFKPLSVEGDALAFMAASGAWHVLFALFIMAFASGMLVVPLYAILQTRSAANACAQSIAATNIANSLFMVLLSLFAALLLKWGLSIPQLIGTLGLETILLTFIAFGPTLVDLRADIVTDL